MRLDELGKTIKDRRKSQNLTQEQLANKVGISRMTLGKLERGRMGAVSIKILDQILFTLGYEVDIKSVESYGIPTLE